MQQQLLVKCQASQHCRRRGDMPPSPSLGPSANAACVLAPRMQDGSTPLHYAAAFGQAGVMPALVAAGCGVDATDDARNTPLHLAAGCGFVDTVSSAIFFAMVCVVVVSPSHPQQGRLSCLRATPSSILGP